MHYIVFVGVLIQLAGASLYLRDTIAGTTKPNRITFILWAALPFVGGSAALAEGVGWATLPVFIAGFTPLIILIASFHNKNAYWKLRSYDYFLGSLAVLALVLWWFTDNPTYAIVLVVLANMLAALPTLLKSWSHPETETGISYLTSLIGAASAFFVLEAFSFAELAYPTYLAIQGAVFVLVIYRARLSRVLKLSDKKR